MALPNTEHELTQLFERLGASDPAAWARSQIEEGIPQVLRFLFLRNAWSNVFSENSTAWIDNAIAESKNNPTAPFAGLGIGLNRCLQKGVSQNDLIEIARCIQVEMMISMLYLLDECYDDTGTIDPDSAHMGLFQINRDGEPTEIQLSGLHESALELDPSGREMRPPQNFE